VVWYSMHLIRGIFLFFIASNILDTSMSVNILSIQMVPFYSHQVVHHKLLKELSLRGHNLTVFSTYSMDFTGLNVTQFVFPKPELAKLKLFESKVKEISNSKFYLINVFDGTVDATKSELEYPKIRELMNKPPDTKFDLLIIECGFCPLLVLADIYNCPIVSIYAADPANKVRELIGNYVHSGIHPEIYTTIISQKNLNFFERLVSLVIENFSVKVLKTMGIRISQFLLTSIYPNLKFRNLHDIMTNRLAILMSGVSTMTIYVRPTVPNYHQIGFIHVDPPKELIDEGLRNFLDESTEGVIVVSFGTIAVDFPEQLLIRFVEVFKELPFNFVWKADREKFKHLDIPENILLSNWLPLADILAHPNVKVVISQGGLRTIEEAIDREIPMIIIPINFDQPFNAILQTENKIATNLDLNTFIKEDLKEAIMEMTKPQYKENIKHVKALVYDKMSTSLEEAADSIEHLIKHNDTFQFQMYDARLTTDHSEIVNDILFMIGRFVILFYTIVNYFL